jgi:glycosidase
MPSIGATTTIRGSSANMARSLPQRIGQDASHDPACSLYGTPFLYNGEEIGMSNATYAGSRGLFHDVGTKNDVLQCRKNGYTKSRFFPICTGAPASTPGPRCNGMRPSMPAFRRPSRSTPPIPNYLEGVNVLDEMKDPYSILNFYQYAIALRKDPLINDQVLNGAFDRRSEPPRRLRLSA